jgi:arylsulfatase A-like enzyme
MVINELRINPHQRCLGHVLTQAGYQTSYIGKWHLYANELGAHDEARNSFVRRGPHRLGWDGEWKAFNFHHENYGEKSYYHTETPRKIHYGEGIYEPDAQTDFAIDFMQRSARQKAPFACVLSWGPPHDPWGPDNVPARFWDMFKDTQFPHPPNYLPADDLPYADKWAKFRPGERERLESWRRGYYAQVASIDWNFGRLMRALEAAGVARDTIVVFTSDHGELFGAHGRRAKNIFYEEAVRVPMLLRWPGGIPAGRRSDVCLSTVDIMPTLLDLMGLGPDIPGEAEGMSLAPHALGKPGPEPQAAFMQICGSTAAFVDGHEWRALRDKRFTYARFRVDGRELFFDNVADPYQMNNLIADPAHSALIRGYRGMMQAKMDSLKDNFAPCTWYEKNWTDGQRRIIRSATADWSKLPVT